MDPSKNHLAQIRELLDSIEKGNLSRDDSNSVDHTQQTVAPMQLQAVSSGGSKNPHNAEGGAITLRNLPGRGIGVVATRLIPAGSIILQEDATLTVSSPHPITLEFLSDLVSRFVSCSAEVRKQVLALHAYESPDRKADVPSLLTDESGEPQLPEHQVELITRLNSVFATNTFDNAFSKSSSLHLQASRFNHSCLPNCDYGHTKDGDRITMTVLASRDIQPGEEICLTYLDFYDRRGNRMACLDYNWGFVCSCPACDVDNPAVDTAAHEEMLAEYRQLKQDPQAIALYSERQTRLWSKELDEILKRSIRRGEITQALGDSYAHTMNLVVSSMASKQKWLWTGDSEDFKKHVRFLEEGQLLAERIAPSPQGQELKAKLERVLSDARKLSGTR